MCLFGEFLELHSLLGALVQRKRRTHRCFLLRLRSSTVMWRSMVKSSIIKKHVMVGKKGRREKGLMEDAIPCEALVGVTYFQSAFLGQDSL